MALSDIPGYRQGYILSDASTDYYSGGNFIDQSGYGSDLIITIGTPSFVTTNGQRGMTLDNTCQGTFLCANRWDGMWIMVMSAAGHGVNGSVYPIMIGQNATAGSNGFLRIQRAAGPVYRHALVSTQTGATAEETYNNNGLKVTAFEMNQRTRIPYRTTDGVTVTAGSAIADSGHGNALSTGAMSVTSDIGLRARFGNMNGTIGNSTATTNTGVMYEFHCFDPEALVDSEILATVAIEMAALKTKYGV